MTTPPSPNEALREAADAYDAFVKAREAMNAAIPALDASPAERALYDERYRADHEAEREHWRTAIKLAQSAWSILAQPPSPASSPVGEGDNALLNTARRNIRTFINGASFKCSADKEAALACVDVLESNLSQPTPASARDNQAIWDALRDFTLADGRTLESFFVKGNDKINFCCLIASLSPLSGEPAS